jgi:Domain of unknown function (DUF4365)
LFPQQQIEELLSLAYVQAIASRAGVSLSLPDRDYGIDGTFRQITILGSRRFPSGYALDFQLKASTRYQTELNHIVYDLEVKTYNDLINRRLGGYAIPCILILKTLSSAPNQWMEVSEEGLFLQGGCYWEYLQGNPSTNQETVRVRIPRMQQLTPESLVMMLSYVTTGEW